MSLITQTVTAVTTAVFSQDVLTQTVTAYLSTTLPASFGQTVTISPPPITPSAISTTKYTPSLTTVATVTSVITVTEIDIFLQNAQGGVYSTWMVPLTPNSSSAATAMNGAPLVYVVNPQDHGGWDTWSTGAKAGLIVGMVVAGPVDPHMGMGPGMSIVQPTMVNGPVVPYGPGGQGRQGYVFGYV
ncbi:hypothetical protein H2202_008338 [Exophiala xenobiotica]|nr:hypothetical protein H2202_008338 [Exophiala xenobiotica]